MYNTTPFGLYLIAGGKKKKTNGYKVHLNFQWSLFPNVTADKNEVQIKKKGKCAYIKPRDRDAIHHSTGALH